MNPNLLNGTTLAYIGDSYYEHKIRVYLLTTGQTKVNTLHKMATKFTSGSSQSKIIRYLQNESLVTEEELKIFKKGRNQSGPGRKNIDQTTYHESTGFEALIGYLSLSNPSRADELIDLSIRYIEGAYEK